MEIPTLRENKRGCGYRSPGGLYLVSDGPGETCAKLPIALKRCPTCGGGIKPSRGWTWIQPNELTQPEAHGSAAHSRRCPFATGVERAGLLWVGGQFYTPQEFADEAHKMGVSRRIAAVPNDYEPGTWVFLAHRQAEWEPCEECGDVITDECENCDGVGTQPVPAIFHAFVPDRIEYVVKGDETDEQLERMAERGIRPVRVEPITEEVPT